MPERWWRVIPRGRGLFEIEIDDGEGGLRPARSTGRCGSWGSSGRLTLGAGRAPGRDSPRSDGTALAAAHARPDRREYMIT